MAMKVVTRRGREGGDEEREENGDGGKEAVERERWGGGVIGIKMMERENRGRGIEIESDVVGRGGNEERDRGENEKG